MASGTEERQSVTVVLLTGSNEQNKASTWQRETSQMSGDLGRASSL